MTENTPSSTEAKTSTESPPPKAGGATKDTERIAELEAANEALRDRLATLEAAVTNSAEAGDDAATQPDADANGSDGFGLSRRGALAGLASLGVLGAASGPASAQTNHDHLGENWSGSPGTGYGLRVELEDQGQALQGIAGINTNNSDDIGLQGKTYSNDGVGLFGHAVQSSGQTRGLVGRVDSPNGKGLQGRATATATGDSIGVEGRNAADEGTAILGKATASSTTTYGVRGETNSSDGYGLYTPDDAKVDGDLLVSGVKNFVQTVSSDAGPKQVKYTSVEAGEPQTEHSDVVELEDGVAVVELPDHFGMVTSGDERLAVQVTPYCDEPVQPQVTDRSTDRIVVKDFSDGPDEYSFAYTVKGVRQGFEDQQVVSDSS
jgi:hypothetical protein